MNRYCQHYHKMGMSVCLCMALGQCRRAKKGGNPHAVIAPLPHYLKGIELTLTDSFVSFPSYIASKRNAPHA